MKPCATDLQANALLLAILERSGGDLRTAFCELCAKVTIDDLMGEPFERALARAVGTYFQRPGVALHGLLGAAVREPDA